MFSSPAASRPATPRALSSSADKSEAPHGCQERLMQVKVLYTFDDNNKTNCLARCPQPMNIRTAFLDPAAEIGIIELRTCIQAIVGASPELIAKLGQDYTVYAYDYSEYETPLVGQGMLSWVLASASSTPMAPASLSRTMVTGRVCKNILGLFSDGVRETLEVKLRLVPVPTCLQSEYLANMEKYRDASNLATESFDADAWTTFLRANPSFDISPQGHENRSSLNAPVDMDNNLFEHMSDAVLAGFGNDGSELLRPQSALGRPSNVSVGTELQNWRSTTPSRQEKTSRPSSRASNRSTRPSRQKAPTRAASYQGQESAGLEEGPSRKRARTTKSNWQGPSPFASNSESLRVTASTAASIRCHKLSSHPTASELATGDFGIRPPTPRPHSALPRKQLGLARLSTSLAHEIVTRSETYVSPYTLDTTESAFTSPERPNGSTGSTPADIPSSPPVFQPRSPTPSSPALPMLPHHQDSGFASGALEHSSPEDDDELRPLDEEDIEVASRYKKRPDPTPPQLSITEEIPGDPSLLPRKMLPRPAPRPPSRSNARKSRARMPATSSPRLPPLSAPLPENYLPQISSELEKPQCSDTDVPFSNSANSGSEAFKRSESCTSDSVARVESSDTAVDSRPSAARHGTGSSLKRKKAIQDRLASSIAAGELPPFCRNCGEINTPTWRKAFVRVESGSPDALQLSETEDGILAWETVSTGEDGRVTSYRITRKLISPEEKGFEEVQLCNPCGIWLFKNRTMRPPEKWAKGPAPEAAKPRRRPSRKKSLATETVDAQAESDSQHGSSANEQWASRVRQSSPSISLDGQHHRALKEAKRASSMCEPKRSLVGIQLLEDAAAAAALKKAIQSSPPRFPGSKHSPIDLDSDLSPQSTRRLLFPSPRRPGEVKNLDGPSLDDSSVTMMKLNETKAHDPFSPEDKENLPPIADSDDNGLDDLFEASETAGTPRTPKAGPRAEEPFKTPSGGSSKRGVLTSNEFLSSAGKAFGGPKTPIQAPPTAPFDVEQMTPFTAQLTQLISEAQYSPVENMFDNDSSHDPGLFTFPDLGEPHADVHTRLSSSSPPGFSLYEDPGSAGGPWGEDPFLEGSINAFLEQNNETKEVVLATDSAAGS